MSVVISRAIFRWAGAVSSVRNERSHNNDDNDNDNDNNVDDNSDDYDNKDNDNDNNDDDKKRTRVLIHTAVIGDRNVTRKNLGIL